MMKFALHAWCDNIVRKNVYWNIRSYIQMPQLLFNVIKKRQMIQIGNGLKAWHLYSRMDSQQVLYTSI